MSISLVQWMHVWGGEISIFGSLHSHYKGTSPIPGQWNMSEKPRHCVCGALVCRLCASWPEHPYSCLITFCKGGQDVNHTSAQNSVPGVSCPHLDQGCLGLSLMRVTRKRKKPTRGSQRFLPWDYPEELSPGQHRRARRRRKAATNCPYIPFLTLTSLFLPLFPLGYP